jgi:hypothetical protein
MQKIKLNRHLPELAKYAVFADVTTVLHKKSATARLKIALLNDLFQNSNFLT